MIKKLQLIPLCIHEKSLNHTKKDFSYNSIYSEPVDICYFDQRENICLTNTQLSEKENVNTLNNQSESFMNFYNNNKRGGTAKICLHSKEKINFSQISNKSLLNFFNKN